ncbi:DUF4382 domain-containing protein [Halapricum hydrolyticum]|uniref:DUF4382 domain-containing protein n=1 Tax=Halapricum hydrolyticum TaxID=2979991 RepID=A0AAE3I9E0_9EURY|nr:DUF4382 domain-containing protein [Halapricum hydrolyticum]MCU4718201.1 DUF4382 domain-containing protein [Halapricum hydrolyticum]MCU4726358.1 DUF4382 domain-containing protein [Halapricum hydrolyticum]
MTPSRHPSTPRDENGHIRRRRFLLTGTAVGTTLLAGCSGDTGNGGANSTDTGDGGATDDSTPGETSTSDAESDPNVGTFRLLISDRPVAIDEFDSLDVTFDRARVFQSGKQDGDSDDGETEVDGAETETEAEVDENETETETETETERDESETGTVTEISEDETGTVTEIIEDETETVTEIIEDETETEADEDDGNENGDPDDERGFFVLDLDGATVDLTQVVGDKAMGVFEDDLPAGRYSKIELHAADVEGIVDGESVSVKIPSGKLQIVKPFEVTPGETLEFVFDINVVKKGKSGGYNLLPVISESGVAGKDVDVEEIDPDERSEDSGRDTSEDGETDADEGDETDADESDETDSSGEEGTSGDGNETTEAGSSQGSPGNGNPDQG